MTLVVLIVLLVGGGLVAAFTLGKGDKPAPKHENIAAPGTRNALVSTVVDNPRVNVFFGRSCTGPRGPWFLNVVQGGSTDVVRMEYYLQWTFADGQASALPDGRVTVTGGTQPPPTLSLARGVLNVSGKRADGTPVTGTGHLEVRLSGTDASPTLTITETGLEEQQQALGLLSPFQKEGKPVTVPIQRPDRLDGCPTA